MMTARDFLRMLYTACRDDKRFDQIEGVAEVRSTVDAPDFDTLVVYPFDGPDLIITVKRVA
jgi:hypothetical protein